MENQSTYSEKTELTGNQTQETDKIQIGLFGFGCVGQGLYDVINEAQNLKASIQKICVKDKNKKRKIDQSYFTYDKSDIFNQKDLDVVVELIDTADQALELVETALNNKTDVVSANKKLIAENFKRLYDLQKANNSALLYEGACAGSIPIIRTLEEYYDNELVSSVRGILNGSTNYILTKMELEGKPYEEVLTEAQEIGFAEADPWLDVAGFDPKYKISILTAHAFGVIVNPEDVLNLGIQNVSTEDIQYAKEKDLRIKLIASTKKEGEKIRVYVLPSFVKKGTDLYNILNEYNAVEIEGAFSDKQTFVGKGAGSHPTGSAVLSDISALTYNYKYGYKKLKKNLEEGITQNQVEKDFSIKLYIRYSNPEEIKDLEVLDVYEKYTSSNYNYIIADVQFKSLFNFYNNKESKVFFATKE